MACIVIEDDRAVADALCALLRTASERVAVYGDAESFMADATVSSSDIVIVDIGLPGKSGLDLIRWMHEVRDLHPRIIAISGRGSTDLSQLSNDEKLGLSHFLRKPPAVDWLPVILGDGASPLGG